MVHLEPSIEGDRCGVAKFFFYEVFQVHLIGNVCQALPIFGGFVIVVGYFVASCAAIVDDAALKQGVLVRHYGFPELWRNHAAVPIEVDVGDVDSGNAAVFVNREDSFEEHAVNALKRRPQLASLGGELLKHVDGACAANGEENHAAQLSAGGLIFVEDVVDAFHQRVAGGNDVANEHGGIGVDVVFLISDVEPGDYSLRRYHAFARQKTHVVDLNAAAIAAFLEWIV